MNLLTRLYNAVSRTLGAEDTDDWANEHEEVEETLRDRIIEGLWCTPGNNVTTAELGEPLTVPRGTYAEIARENECSRAYVAQVAKSAGWKVG